MKKAQQTCAKTKHIRKCEGCKTPFACLRVRPLALNCALVCATATRSLHDLAHLQCQRSSMLSPHCGNVVQTSKEKHAGRTVDNSVKN